MKEGLRVAEGHCCCCCFVYPFASWAWGSFLDPGNIQCDVSCAWIESITSEQERSQGILVFISFSGYAVVSVCDYPMAEKKN